MKKLFYLCSLVLLSHLLLISARAEDVDLKKALREEELLKKRTKTLDPESIKKIRALTVERNRLLNNTYREMGAAASEEATKLAKEAVEHRKLLHKSESEYFTTRNKFKELVKKMQVARRIVKRNGKTVMQYPSKEKYKKNKDKALATISDIKPEIAKLKLQMSNLRDANADLKSKYESLRSNQNRKERLSRLLLDKPNIGINRPARNELFKTKLVKKLKPGDAGFETLQKFINVVKEKNALLKYGPAAAATTLAIGAAGAAEAAGTSDTKIKINNSPKKVAPAYIESTAEPSVESDSEPNLSNRAD